jgi:sulfur-oxidizing protein SoxY
LVFGLLLSRVASNLKLPTAPLKSAGLQRELVSQGFVPAFYINKVAFAYNAAPLLSIDVGVGTSEDPYFKFNFVPAALGKLDVTANDNEGKSFVQQIDVSH